MATREQWLNAGLVRFGRAGLAGLSVEAMARDVGSSKAGFYWYFKSRPAFEKALWDHWRLAETKAIIAAAERADTPMKRIALLFDQVIHLRKSGDFLFHLRRVAQKRASLERMLDDIEGERIGYLASVLTELGSAPELAEVVYHLYLGWYERHRFAPTARAEAQRQLRFVSRIIGVDLTPRSRT